MMPKDERSVFLIYPYKKEIEDVIGIIQEFFASYKSKPEVRRNIKHAADFRSSTDLLQRITSSIKECDLAIVILGTARNNVAFELGMVHILEKDYILIVPEPYLGKIKREFSDISGLKYMTYDPKGILKLRDKLKRELKTLENERKRKVIKQTTPEYLVALGDAFFQQGLYSEAILKYKAAVDIKKDFYEAWVRLGDGHLQNYELIEAETALRKAINLRPQDIIAYEKLGQVLLDAGQYEKAINECFEPLINLRPKVTTYYYKIADTFCELGFPDKAVEYLLRAIEKIGEVAALYYDCAWCSIRQSHRVEDDVERENWIQKGIQALRKSIDLDSSYARRAVVDKDFDPVRDRTDFPTHNS
ncbi:MAG: tetratricopeptide repeat protein [Nitrospirota bacterium]